MNRLMNELDTTSNDCRTLQLCEQSIRQHSHCAAVASKHKVWIVYYRIKSHGLWRYSPYRNFEEYCLHQLECKKTQAYTMVKAGEVIEYLISIDFEHNYNLPLPESLEVAAKLAKIAKPNRAKYWVDTYIENYNLA